MQGVIRSPGFITMRRALFKDDNAADGCFPSRPKGSPQIPQSGVAVLAKGGAIACEPRLAINHSTARCIRQYQVERVLEALGRADLVEDRSDVAFPALELDGEFAPCKEFAEGARVQRHQHHSFLFLDHRDLER